MRRTLAIGLFCALAVAALAAGPSNAGPAVRTERDAHADWLISTGKKGHFDWYYAFVWQSEGYGDEGPNFASIGRGTCYRERAKRSVTTSCEGTDGISGDAATDFEMDPSVASASLEIKRNGKVHRVRWTASGNHPGLYSASEFCFGPEGEEEGQGEGGGIFRPASVTARILGTRFDKGRGAMSSGAMVTQCGWGRHVELNDDGTIDSLVIRTPR